MSIVRICEQQGYDVNLNNSKLRQAVEFMKYAISNILQNLKLTGHTVGEKAGWKMKAEKSK